MPRWLPWTPHCVVISLVSNYNNYWVQFIERRLNSWPSIEAESSSLFSISRMFVETGILYENKNPESWTNLVALFIHKEQLWFCFNWSTRSSPTASSLASSAKGLINRIMLLFDKLLKFTYKADKSSVWKCSYFSEYYTKQ